MKKPIYAFQTSQESVVTDQAQLEETACLFYENLYSTRTTNEMDMNTLLDSIDTKVPLHSALHINRPIQEDEVLYAIKCSGNNKSPGPDGLTVE